MGETFSISAFRDRTVAEVTQGICKIAAQFGVEAEAEGVDEDEESDVRIFASPNGWTVAFWPDSFLGDDPFWRELSRATDTLVSTAGIYDGGTWHHVLADRGKLIDRFESRPEEFLKAEVEIERAREEWRGNPQVIAAYFGVSPDVIQPYLAYREEKHSHRPTRRKGLLQWLGFVRQEGHQESIKAFPDDECDVGDAWVFIDFWRRLGIVCPEETSEWDKRLRFPVETLQDRVLHAERGGA